MTTSLSPAAGPSRQLTLSLDDFKQVVSKPLRLLPPPVQADALALWACHRHLEGMGSALSIAGAVSVWIERHGLRPDDARDILRDMLSPDRMGTFRFASDLMTELAGLARQKIAGRRKQAELARLKDEEARAAADALPPERVRAMLSGLMSEIATAGAS